MDAATDTGTGGLHKWLRYAPPAAALSVAWLLQVTVVTDVLGTAIADLGIGTVPAWVWYAVAAVFGVAVATSLEAGAAYLMGLYDRHLLARDSVWQLRAGMVAYVAVSAVVIHWWLGYRGLPEVIAVVLAGMSASALWLWSRGARWAQRREMVAAGQIDPALPRLPAVSKVMHPVRWIVTLYLISWEPVQTTDEARARYAEWKQSRRGRPWRSTSSSRRSADGGGSSSASGSGTGSSRRPARRSRRSASAGAARSRGGGASSTATLSGPNGNGAGGRPNLRGRSVTELTELVLTNSWQNESQNSLASLLSVSKTTAAEVQRAARERLKRNSQPAPGEPAGGAAEAVTHGG